MEAYWDNTKIDIKPPNPPVHPVYPNRSYFEDANNEYMVGPQEREETTGNFTYLYFKIAKKKMRGEHLVASETARIYSHLDHNTIEHDAYCVLQSNCANHFVLRTFFLRSGSLYARTQRNVPRILKKAPSPVLEKVQTLSDFLQGWTYISPTSKYIPFDGKNYTSIDAAGEVEFKVSIPFHDYNTIALTGLIADSLNIEFKNPSNNIIDYKPDNRRDKNSRLPAYQKTVILYNKGKTITVSSMSGADKSDNYFTLTLKGKKIRLGSIVVGLSANAGFTNLVFTNKYIDYSPYEKDQWGNVTYVKGLKVNSYSGTVDVPIDDYDMMNRLMVSLGASEVILNGSDNLDNTPPNGEKGIFAATMVVGRIKDFQLSTRLDNNHLGSMASYKFTIEESV
jgi:hypothetical protein